MAEYVISNHEMDRRRLVNQAGSLLLDAMLKHTTDNGEMTALEWMEALAVASDRFRRDALKEEWEQAPDYAEVKA
jgi:hypothetical protein